MRSIGFLAHDQSRLTRPKTFVSKEDADLLVTEMVAERLSAKLIRAFAPDSKFLRGRNFCRNYIPDKLAPVEVEGTYFQPPRSARLTTGVPRTHYLARFREIFGDNQLIASL